MNDKKYISFCTIKNCCHGLTHTIIRLKLCAAGKTVTIIHDNTMSG